MNSEQDDLLRRFEDLADRCERSCTVTATGFLTPGEQYKFRSWCARRPDVRAVISGGADGCERAMAFFLPYYIEPDDLDVSEYICAVKIQAAFETPTHRDYMGAVLGLGIRREWIGDFRVKDNAAFVFCQPSVEALLLSDLDKVGRAGVRVTRCALADIPSQDRKVTKKTFTVKSLRLDAVCAEMFGLSRTSAAEFTRAGGVSLNYEVCQRPDAPIREGDVLSLRGHGKGMVSAIGGKSKKDRLFVEAEIYR